MAEQLLSQEEIDALLIASATGGERPAQGSFPKSASVEPYDLARQERIVRGRMPALELIHERFSRNLRIGLFNFMRRNPEVIPEPVVVGKYATFMSTLVAPSNINVMQIRPLHGSALLIMEPELVASIVDIMFGGCGRASTRVEGREFSATEQRLILRIIELVCAEYRKAWEAFYPLELVYSRSEMQPQFANIATPTEIVISARFQIHLGEQGGALHLCIPYTALEPIRETLFSSVNANPQSNGRGWMGALSREIEPASVDLVAELTSAEITIGELINLTRGDIIEIRTGMDAQLKVGQVPVFEGQFGEFNSRYAVRIDTVHSYTDKP
ncbi:MAG TPA: flagellar motor switch protein FliM [Lautropia sp.]|jgi:flagellar motor switch protein FliM|nr:flagellar motor switch protein FliM [Lautropia sp.]